MNLTLQLKNFQITPLVCRLSVIFLACGYVYLVQYY